LQGHTGPDICYVEQAQETLAYIQKLGIPAIAAKWYAQMLIECVFYFVTKMERSVKIVYLKDLHKNI
jgi:hypothetical protein